MTDQENRNEKEINELKAQMYDTIANLKKMKDQMVILKNQKNRCYLVTVGKKHLMFASLKDAKVELNKSKSKAKLRSFGSPEARARFIENKKEKERKSSRKTAVFVTTGRITGFLNDQSLLEFSVANFPNASFSRVDLEEKSSSFLRGIHSSEFYQQILFKATKWAMEEKGYNYFFYVDGTTNLSKGVFTSGFVLEHKEKILKKQAYSFDAELPGCNRSSQAAELQSAMLAVMEAKRNGINKFCIVFDRLDIITAKLTRSTKCRLSSSYYDWMERETAGMDIEFIKAKAHIGIEGNELVDQLVYEINAEPTKIYKR